MKELLKKLLAYTIKERVYHSMCVSTRIMRDDRIISAHEENCLDAYIEKNRPKRGKHFDETFKRSPWFWALGMKKPRIAFLKDLIKRTPHSLKI